MEFSFECLRCGKKVDYLKDRVLVEYRNLERTEDEYWLGCCDYASFYFDKNDDIISYELVEKSNKIYMLCGNIDESSILIDNTNIFTDSRITTKFIPIDTSIPFKNAYDKVIKKIEALKNFK